MNNFLISLGRQPFKNIVVIAAVVGFLYYMALLDLGESLDVAISNMQTSVEQEERRKQETDRALERRDQLKFEIEALQANFEELIKRLPINLNSSVLVRNIQALAREAGADIKSVRGGSPVRHDFLEEIPAEVVLEGEFSNLALFVYTVSKSESLTRLKDFKIEKARGIDGPYQQLELTGTVSSYRLLPVSEAQQSRGGR